jgi:ribosomal protein S18 acetylase RimI-like enzyme
VSIRKAEPFDARSIAEVQVKAWQRAYRGLLPEETLDNLSVEGAVGRWAERLEGSWGEFMVREQEDRVIGFVACGPSRDEDLGRQVGEVYVLYVAPDAWRQGHGGTLLREELKILRQSGYREAILWVLHNNEGAKRFYERMGFESDHTTRIITRSDGTPMKVTRYRREL